MDDQAANPFPSLNQTEYALLRLIVREEVTAGVRAAMDAYNEAHCDEHKDATAALERVVFGSAENGIVGIDEQIKAHERQIGDLLDSIKWAKRMVYSALFVGVVGLVVTLLQATVVGG